MAQPSKSGLASFLDEQMSRTFSNNDSRYISGSLVVDRYYSNYEMYDAIGYFEYSDTYWNKKAWFKITFDYYSPDNKAYFTVISVKNYPPLKPNQSNRYLEGEHVEDVDKVFNIKPKDGFKSVFYTVSAIIK
jgi:hypothetical protein